MLLTDDVYGTFVSDFPSLLGELPQNTIGVYSYSKYFGATGWRLGVIAIYEDNIFDKMIAKLPDADLRALDKRYGPLAIEPRKIKLIDRMVADSRDIALNHTAGLSLPQQVMMSMFSMAELMDAAKLYQKAYMEIVQRRFWTMVEGLGLELSPNPLYDFYYGLIDFEFWARKNIGADAVEPPWFISCETRLEIQARHELGKWQLREYAGFHKANILARIAVHGDPLFHLSAPTTQLNRCLASPRRDEVHGSAISSFAARPRSPQTPRCANRSCLSKSRHSGGN